MAKRSLMLAGGGVKIPFQAGVLQVWLDEAGVTFDHADAVSAACFNLAMWAQGMTGTQIADNWRNTNPLMEVDADFRDLAKLFYARSLFTLDNFRDKVFPAWGIDIAKIRSEAREATFNVYNFSKHELRPVDARDLSMEYLMATGSLPVWFPPVEIDGDTYIDAVFQLASNLEEAIRRGADEIWVIWTISERGEWFDGFVGNFFGIFEATTVHAYKHIRERIDRNNAALAGAGCGEFGRTIVVKELKAEVPVHYLFNFNQDRAGEAVNRGVEAARAWCDEHGIPRKAIATPVPATHEKPASIEFEEHFGGEVGGVKSSLAVRVAIEDLDAFITQPEHQAGLSGEWNGNLVNGTLRVLIDDGEPDRKEMRYEVFGAGFTITALRHYAKGQSAKDLEVTLQQDGQTTHGTLHSGALETLRELTSFRVHASGAGQRATALARFGTFYFGHLWDVYARQLLPFGPV